MKSMPRTKHGQYDAEKGLPNNTDQPQGSGSIVRWHGQIRESLGEDAGQALIDESRERGGVKWLLAQLAEAACDDLVAAYKQARHADDLARSIRKHALIVQHCQEQLVSETNVSRRAYLEKQIDKAQRYLEKHKEISR